MLTPYELLQEDRRHRLQHMLTGFMGAHNTSLPELEAAFARVCADLKSQSPRSDPKYGMPLPGTVKVVSSDGTDFYFTERELRMSPVFGDMLEAVSGGEPSDQGIPLLDNEFEAAVQVRLLLDLLRNRRVDGDAPETRPTVDDFLRTLRLTHKYEYGTVYKIIVGFLESTLVDSRCTTDTAFRILYGAAGLDDGILARYAVDVLAQAALHAPHTYPNSREKSTCGHEVFKYYINKWTAEEFDRMPKAYIYALSQMPVVKTTMKSWGDGWDRPAKQLSHGDIFHGHLQDYQRL